METWFVELAMGLCALENSASLIELERMARPVAYQLGCVISAS